MTLAFIDTNVLVYSFDGTAPDKQARALALIRDALRSGTGRISAQVIHEFTNVAMRKFSRPLTAAELGTYLDAVLFPMCQVPWTEALVRDALSLAASRNVSWYDALIVAGARASDCATLWSEDLQDGARFGPVRVRNPFRAEE